MKHGILLLAILGLVALASAGDPDLFWIGYRTFIRLKERQPELTYLTQINEFGKTTKAPVSIAPGLRHSFSFSTCLTFGRAGYLNFWTSGVEPHPSHKRILGREEIEIRTLESFLTTPAIRGAGPSYFCSTHRLQNNFMLFKGNEINPSILGMALGKKGELIPSPWTILSPDRNGINHVGISADGRCLVYSSDKLYIRMMSKDGHTVSQPNAINFRYTIYSVSVSNVLAGNKRFLLVSENNYRPGSCLSENYLSLIQINATTGLKLQTVFRNDNGPGDCGGPEVILDPKGRFYLTGALAFNRGMIRVNYPLVYQALDVDGRRSGLPKPVASNVIGNFDMLSINQN